MTFTLTELRECAEREHARRKRVYPVRVNSRRMDQYEANREIALMALIAAQLRHMESHELLPLDR